MTLPKHRSEILEFLMAYNTFDKFQPKNDEQRELNFLNGKASTSFTKLLRDNEYNFLRSYGVQIFKDMVAQESKSQFSSLLTRQR